jgi:capsular exopolysaccharide synthesis family protein
MYKVEATFTVSTQNKTTSISGISAYNFYYDASTASHLSSTFPHILSSNLLQEAVMSDLNVTSLPVSLTASSVTGSNMFTLCATGYDPQVTYDALVSTMKNYPDIAKYVVGNIKFNIITSPILPAEPYNKPVYSNEIFKGIVYGLLLGLFLLLCYTAFRTTIRTKKDVKANLNIKCLGIIPHIILKKRSRKGKESLLITNKITDGRFPESIRSIRSVVKNLMKNGKKVITVTSTVAQEGKTTVCVNIGLAFAAIHKKVLIVDCDTKTPDVLKTLGVNEEGLQHSVVTDEFKIAHLEKHKIDVMTFDSDKKSNELINSNTLTDIFSTVKDDYDLILVDTPPCSVVSDAMFVAQASDGVLYVILQDIARISKIKDSLDSLISTNCEILGCILNGAQTSVMGYGYYKSYNKYGYYRGYGKYGMYGKYGGYNKYGYIDKSIDNFDLSFDDEDDSED